MRDAATMNRLAESDAELARGEHVSAEELAETMRRCQAAWRWRYQSHGNGRAPEVGTVSLLVTDLEDQHKDAAWGEHPVELGEYLRPSFSRDVDVVVGQQPAEASRRYVQLQHRSFFEAELWMVAASQ